MRKTRTRSLWAALLAFTMVLAACGGDDATDTTEAADAPLAIDTTVTTEPVVETPTAETTVPVDEFDLIEAVNAYASTIPDGFMAVGDLQAFKDALTVEGAVLIDVREEAEYAEGHIPGAINLPIRTLAQNLDLIPTDVPVWVYCASGWRAGMSTSSLRMMGYDNVMAYPPGWAGWTEAGEEVSTEAVEAESYGDPGFEPELVAAVDGFLSTIPDGFLMVKAIEDVKAASDAGASLVDVREAGEYAEGFILDATNVPIRTLATANGEIPTDVTVIAYCASGFRAALSVPVLHVLGFDNAKGFPGSYAAWTEAGEPVTTS